MTKKSERISTREFSSLSSLSVSQVSKLLREGKIKGVKKSGKWMISKSQLELSVVQEIVKSQKPVTAKKKSAKAGKEPTSSKKAVANAINKKDQKHKALELRDTPKSPKNTAPKNTYSVAEFSAMTYLTDFGVLDWLKKGRLKGIRNEDGEWRVDAVSLELPNLKRLLRD